MTERITFEPGEFSLPTADLCETNEVMCWVRGGTELCPGMETIDPAKVEGDMPDSGIVFCICECHRLAPTI